MLLVAACKTTDKKPDDKEATPVEKSAGTSSGGSIQDSPTTQHRVRPELPRSDIPETRDWNDPDVREKIEQRRAQREERMKERLDTNKDGVISADERAERARPVFDRLDENQDGKLTPDELSKSNRRMSFDDPAALDTDHNGDISLGELEAAMTARRQQMREKWRGGRPRQVGSADE